MNTRNVFLVLFLIIISGVMMAYFTTSEGVAEGKQAINFEETTLANETLNLKDLRGKYVLLDFWGSWCGPCHDEAPHMKKAYNQFKDQVEFVGIAVDNNRESVKSFIDKYDITWPQIQVPRNHPVSAKLVSQYQVNGYPTLFLIDPEGKIVINGNKESEKLRGEKLISTLDSVVTDSP